MKNYSNQDHYAVLGVTKTSTKDEIRKAARRLLRESHPDKATDKQAAHEKTVQINLAYEILGDDSKRANFDMFGSSDTFAYESRAARARTAQTEAQRKEAEKARQQTAKAKSEFVSAHKNWHGRGEKVAEQEFYDLLSTTDGLPTIKKVTKTYQDMKACYDNLKGLGLRDLHKRYSDCCEYYMGAVNKSFGPGKTSVIAEMKCRKNYQEFFEDLEGNVVSDRDEFEKVYRQQGGEQAVNKKIPIFQKALEKHEAIIKELKQTESAFDVRRPNSDEVRSQIEKKYGEIKPGGVVEKLLREKKTAGAGPSRAY